MDPIIHYKNASIKKSSVNLYDFVVVMGHISETSNISAPNLRFSFPNIRSFHGKNEDHCPGNFPRPNESYNSAREQYDNS